MISETKARELAQLEPPESITRIVAFLGSLVGLDSAQALIPKDGFSIGSASLGAAAFAEHRAESFTLGSMNGIRDIFKSLFEAYQITTDEIRLFTTWIVKWNQKRMEMEVIRVEAVPAPDHVPKHLHSDYSVLPLAFGGPAPTDKPVRHTSVANTDIVDRRENPVKDEKKKAVRRSVAEEGVTQTDPVTNQRVGTVESLPRSIDYSLLVQKTNRGLIGGNLLVASHVAGLVAGSPTQAALPQSSPLLTSQTLLGQPVIDVTTAPIRPLVLTKGSFPFEQPSVAPRRPTAKEQRSETDSTRYFKQSEQGSSNAGPVQPGQTVPMPVVESGSSPNRIPDVPGSDASQPLSAADVRRATQLPRDSAREQGTEWVERRRRGTVWPPDAQVGGGFRSFDNPAMTPMPSGGVHPLAWIEKWQSLAGVAAMMPGLSGVKETSPELAALATAQESQQPVSFEPKPLFVGAQSEEPPSKRSFLITRANEPIKARPEIGMMTLVAPQLLVADAKTEQSGSGVAFDWKALIQASGSVDEAGLAAIAKVLPRGAKALYPALPETALPPGAVNLRLSPGLARTVLTQGYGPRHAALAEESSRMASGTAPAPSPDQQLKAEIVPMARPVGSKSLFGEEHALDTKVLKSAGSAQASRGGALDFLGVPVRLAPSLSGRSELSDEVAIRNVGDASGPQSAVRPELFSQIQQKLLKGAPTVAAEPDKAAWRKAAPSFGIKESSPHSLLTPNLRVPSEDGQGPAPSRTSPITSQRRLSVPGRASEQPTAIGSAPNFSVPFTTRTPLLSSPSGATSRSIPASVFSRGSEGLSTSSTDTPDLAPRIGARSSTVGSVPGPRVGLADHLVRRNGPGIGHRVAGVSPLVVQGRPEHPVTPNDERSDDPDFLSITRDLALSRPSLHAPSPRIEVKQVSLSDTAHGVARPGMTFAPQARSSSTTQATKTAIQMSKGGPKASAHEGAREQSSDGMTQRSSERQSGLETFEMNLLADEVYSHLRRRLEFEAARSGR